MAVITSENAGDLVFGAYQGGQKGVASSTAASPLPLSVEEQISS